MTTETIILRDISERDMDHLLLEEFVSSEAFCRQFLKLIEVNDELKLVMAERSVISENGESDLELTFVGDAETFMLLIENKVDAPLQFRQAERYVERGQVYCESGRCHRVAAVIVAPASYFAASLSHGFHRCVTYEQLLGWFENASELGQRRVYKLAAIKRAIERGKSGWQLRPNEVTTGFWHNYWKLSLDYAQELCMPEPRLKPRDSNFVRFRPPIVPSEVSFIHQVPYGRVDLQFPAMAEKLADLNRRFGNKMSSEMRIVVAAKSGAIRIKVPEIDMQAPFAESECDVRKALKAAVSLLGLFEGPG